jgi:integrase
MARDCATVGETPLTDAKRTASAHLNRKPFEQTKPKIRLSGAAIKRMECPPTKQQELFWDVDCPSLGVRVTKTGYKAYIFQGFYRGKDVRVTIGRTDAWPIPDAQKKARELQRMIDNGRDPRDLKREADAEHARRVAEDLAKSLTAQSVWEDYMARGRPPGREKKKWSVRYKADLEKFASPGGEKKKRGKGLTRQGPLVPLLQLSLLSIDDDVQKEWFDEEEETSGLPQATRAFRMFQAFLNWCLSEPKYKRYIQACAIAPASVTRYLGGSNARKDVIEKSQLKPWWRAVESLENSTASVFLRVCLLTGSRREQLASLQWKDVSFQWKRIHLHDKVHGERNLPLTPYVEKLLLSLKNNGDYVFAAETESGYISEPSSALSTANRDAGGVEVTVHGLRRSFRTLVGWIDPPVAAGVIAQIMGHKPSATAEKHYNVIPLEMLKVHHQRIERWFLDEVGVTCEFQSKRALKYPDLDDSGPADEPSKADQEAITEHERRCV